VVDAATVIGMVALVVLLLHRLTDPVRRFLSTFQDYLIWAMAFLPLLTGYLAYHHIVEPYTTALALHILSVEILMVVFPFTKLMHTFTLFMGRWYNGAMAGHRGVHS
jgi:nitrate reductase gamma subunit